MKSFRVCLLLLLAALPVLADDDKPQPVELLTRWAKDLKPDAPLPEYPRPQMARKEWLSLNGTWQFEPARAGLPQGRDLKDKILVPFPVESRLSGIGKRTERVWYRRTFAVPAAWKNQRVLLHFDAVNWESGIYLNGKLAGTHKGGYDAFWFDVTDNLKEGDNELLVGAINGADWNDQPRGKQANYPEREWHTAATGIWQTVWLEPVPASYVTDLDIAPDADTSSATFKVSAANAEGDAVLAEVFEGAQKIAEARGVAGANFRVALPNAKLWSPDSPFLYDVKFTLLHDGKVADSVSSYFGLRKIALGFDEKNRRRITLNGKILFGVGVLDQGYWPEGVYTAPTDEALRFDIETAKKLGFNSIRKFAKIEPERWYYWADKLGILVWQDMPNAKNDTPRGKRQFEAELRRLIETKGNHPSIVAWVLFNEWWGQGDVPRLTQVVKTLDPSRLVDSASGGSDFGAGDVVDSHHLPWPEARPPEATRASVTGEFGGLDSFAPGHSWMENPTGKQTTLDPALLARNYEKAWMQAAKLRDDPGLSAAFFKQLTDVETEGIGLLTYDRAQFKIAPARIAKANRGEASLTALTTLLPTAKDAPKEAPNVWKYTTDKPADDWTMPGFDDAAWPSGPAGFGKDTTSAPIGTEWKTKNIWLRREVEIPDPTKTLLLLVQHDEDFELYINGVLAAKEKDHRSDYGEFSLTPEARAALKPGKNLIAVHCKQTEGAQYIDVGIGQIN